MGGISDYNVRHFSVGANRNRAFGNHDPIAIHASGDFFCHRKYSGNIRRAVGSRRCTNGQENNQRIADRFFQIGGEGKPSGRNIVFTISVRPDSYIGMIP